jgi:hypothetical protein
LLLVFKDFLGFTREEEQLARSTAVIEAHSLELEGGELLGKSGKKKDNGKIVILITFRCFI